MKCGRKPFFEGFFFFFNSNRMKVNPDKFHLLCNRKLHQVNIYNGGLSSRCNEKNLGIKTYKISFDQHVDWLCRKSSQKVKVSLRVSSLMKFGIRKHFSYCSLMCINH